MTEFVLKLLCRAGQTVQNPFGMGAEYVRPKQGDARRDFHKIAGDMRKVGSDLRKVSQRELEKYGK